MSDFETVPPGTTARLAALEALLGTDDRAALTPVCMPSRDAVGVLVSLGGVTRLAVLEPDELRALGRGIDQVLRLQACRTVPLGAIGGARA